MISWFWFSLLLELLTFLGIFKTIFNLVRATHCSPGRTVSLVCKAMRSFLVSTVVTHKTFVWLIFKYSIGTITHRWF